MATLNATSPAAAAVRAKPAADASGLPYPVDTLNRSKQSDRRFDRLLNQQNVLLHLLGIFEALAATMLTHAPDKPELLGTANAAAMLARALYDESIAAAHQADIDCIAAQDDGTLLAPDVIWHYGTARAFMATLSAISVLRDELCTMESGFAGTQDAPLVLSGLLTAAAYIIVDFHNTADVDRENLYTLLTVRCEPQAATTKARRAAV